MNYAWPSVFGCCKQYPRASAEHIVPGNSVQVGVEAKRLQDSQIVPIAIVRPLLETAERFPAHSGAFFCARAVPNTKITPSQLAQNAGWGTLRASNWCPYPTLRCPLRHRHAGSHRSLLGPSSSRKRPAGALGRTPELLGRAAHGCVAHALPEAHTDAAVCLKLDGLGDHVCGGRVGDTPSGRGWTYRGRDSNSSG